MRLRVFHTESFRLAAIFAALFLGFAGILVAAVYWIVQDTQTTTLFNAVDADITTIQNGFAGEGLPEAIEVIQQRLGPPQHSSAEPPDSYILLQDQDGLRLAGNLPPLSPTLGLVSLREPRSGDGSKYMSDGKGHRSVPKPGTVLGKGLLLTKGVYLFVGRNTAAIAGTRARILQAFAWLTGATIILAAVGGVLFSMQFLRRIDAITRTCNSIMKGRFDERITLRGSHDELDQLSGAINSMLDRISALLDNLRQVSSDVAHDLRTPLTHLRQRLEDARAKSASTQEYSTAVTQAIDDVDELLAIFTALLRISQIETGTRMASFATFSLSELLDRMYETYLPVAEDHGKALQRSIQQGVLIRGDSELLLQMFSNLIENAIRHTPAGTVIVIGLAVLGTAAVASISDNGLGIPLEEQDKVLRRFYRVATSRSTPGNGLGLSLVTAIAHLHGSKIELSDNRPGVRATVAIPV